MIGLWRIMKVNVLLMILTSVQISYLNLNAIYINVDGTLKKGNVQNLFVKKYRTSRFALILGEIRLELIKFVILRMNAVMILMRLL